MENSTEDDVVTMLDVLNEEREIDETSKAVLSGSDETKCTYFAGYVKRQALYSCLTCVNDTENDISKSIGICLACSLSCHDGHDLVELYTKRNFRCDCGIKGGVACQLEKNKKNESSSSQQKLINEFNKYNQNFSGLYCVCHRKYPDEEDKVEDTMIQCIICEDWYHSRHLNANIPDSSNYEEMICGDCMDKNKFLYDYIGNAVEVVEDSVCDTTLNVTSLDESLIAHAQAEGSSSAPKKLKLSDDACIRPKSTLKNIIQGKATFWTDEFRKNLCKCPCCLKMYEESGVQFLTDLEDTVHFYEEKGKNKPKASIYDSSLAALQTLPRVNQIDAITSYNRMKDKLFEFLQTFVTNNQIVTEDDIKKFFSTMKNENQTANPHQPHYCR